MNPNEKTLDDNHVYFAAALRPNRSLSPTGFRILMFVASGGALCIGIAFLVIGAWPVLGFGGIEILFLYIAFRFNYRAGRAYEKLCLTRDTLEITRVSPYGKAQKWTMEPSWLQVLMDEPPLHHSKLRLRSHGKSLIIGTFLTPEERLEVAIALRKALYDWQSR
ncbi:MAG: DUF2244 domain-containing protein [Alphaproteobacteria bacterium]